MSRLTAIRGRCFLALGILSIGALVGCDELEGLPCGGPEELACLPGLYCQFEVGECGSDDEGGVCKLRPAVCAALSNPVCGCDDRTYDNACLAALAGVSVAGEGACDTNDGDARACGGIEGLQCAAGEYCRYNEDALCGAADQTGLCEVIPQNCTLEFAPVCGCDDKTYANACFAAAAGVSVAGEGECADDIEVRICGGIQGLACEEGEFCRYNEDALCGAADQTGVCEVIPEVCTEEFAPVCGCDDQTYDNACFAAAAGVSVQSQGECP